MQTIESKLHTNGKQALTHRWSELKKSLVEPYWAQAKPSIRHQMTNYPTKQNNCQIRKDTYNNNKKSLDQTAT